MAKIKITLDYYVEEDDIDELKLRFLRVVPMPLNEDGSDKHTFMEHLRLDVKDHIRQKERQGKTLIDLDTRTNINIE